MSRNFIKGQKSRLSDLTAADALSVEMACQTSGAVPDLSCFGVDESGKLSDDRYFIFYNQKSSPEGALVASGDQGPGRERFQVSLGRLPAKIRRLVFVATLDGADSFRSLQNGCLRLLAGGTPVAEYAFTGADFGEEKAIIVGELYFKEAWRFAAVGQGFNGGLSALLQHFGGEETTAAAPPPPPEPPKVKLSKVRLDKQGEAHKVSLAKGGSPQIFHINLQWDQPASRGLFSSLVGGNKGADLDLGCMWRDRHGMQGVIQPLGGNFGSESGPPYIVLDKDDRSGAAADGENMRIFRPGSLDLVVVFAMIYEGTANFSTVNARLTLKDGAGNEILVPLNAPDARRTFCAVARIDSRGETMQITKEERYFQSHSDCDRHYGFGFRWVAGRK